MGFAVLALTALLQRPACAPQDTYCRELAVVAAERRVRRAVAFLEKTDEQAVRELIALTEIPAPPFKEAERARRYAEMLRDAGADSVIIDEVGNVIALRRGVRRTRTVALAGHIDTVFPEGTDVQVRQHGDTLFAPGIADNTRGLIALLQVMRALVHARIRTDADILIIGTVGEEGLGDLRGTKHLFRKGARRIDTFIAVDAGNDETITSSGIGSKRYRVTFGGPGGHSWGAFGTANPIHALARAIHLFDDAAARFTSSGGATSYNVGRIGGGTSVNSIPTQAWAEVDIRAENPRRLESLDSIFHVQMVTALNEENALRTTGPELTLEARLVGDRPSGETAATVPVVQRAMAATRLLGLTPRIDESSTDANAAIEHGVPAITVGRGGISGNSHSPDEWWINANGVRGIRRMLYILVAEAGLKR